MQKSIEYFKVKTDKKIAQQKTNPLYLLHFDLLHLKATFLLKTKKYTSVIRLVNKVLKNEPEALGFLLLKMVVFKNLGKTNSAKRTLVKIVKIDTRSPTIDPRFNWPSCRTLFYEESLAFIEPIIYKNLKDGVPIETKVKIFNLLERYDDTIDVLDWAYTVEPKNHGLMILKEYILYRLERNDDALSNINRIMKETKTRNKKIIKFRNEIVDEMIVNEIFRREDAM